MEIVTYDVKLRTETISANTRLNDNKYGSWKAYNIGTAPVTVYGVELQPGEGMEWNLEPQEIWKEPIDITVQTGGLVRLMRKLCTPIVTEIKKRK